jgi:hypothetical protein
MRPLPPDRQHVLWAMRSVNSLKWHSDKIWRRLAERRVKAQG